MILSVSFAVSGDMPDGVRGGLKRSCPVILEQVTVPGEDGPFRPQALPASRVVPTVSTAKTAVSITRIFLTDLPLYTCSVSPDSSPRSHGNLPLIADGGANGGGASGRRVSRRAPTARRPAHGASSAPASSTARSKPEPTTSLAWDWVRRLFDGAAAGGLEALDESVLPPTTTQVGCQAFNGGSDCLAANFPAALASRANLTGDPLKLEAPTGYDFFGVVGGYLIQVLQTAQAPLVDDNQGQARQGLR